MRPDVKLSLSTLLVSMFAFGADEKSELGVSGSLLVANNCIWRGMTQTSNTPNAQAGVNLNYNGFYAGVAGSNVKTEGLNATSEVDLLGGYIGNIYGIDYDAGAIYYTYPRSAKEANFADIYLALSKDFERAKLGGKFYRDIKTNDLIVSNAWETTLSIPAPMSISLELLYGDYAHIGNYYSVGLAKPINDTLKTSISYTGIDSDTDGSDEGNIVVMITASF